MLELPVPVIPLPPTDAMAAGERKPAFFAATSGECSIPEVR